MTCPYCGSNNANKVDYEYVHDENMVMREWRCLCPDCNKWFGKTEHYELVLKYEEIESDA